MSIRPVGLVFSYRVHRQTGRQTDRQTQRQTDRQTDRHEYFIVAAITSLGDQLVLNVVDLKIRHIVFLNVPGPQRQLPRDPALPKGTTQEGPPSSPINVEDRPVQAQGLANFKTDMTSLIHDMIQSSQNPFASQFKANSGSN